MTTITPRELRDSLGHYASGVTIITGTDDDGPIGFTCQSFYSVSLEPPLISFSVMKTSTSYPRIRETGRFCVNILAEDQHELSNIFARRGTDKWAGLDWQVSEMGNPVLEGTLLWVDCELQDEYEAGDHYIVVGRVVELGALDAYGRQPLVFFKGTYSQLHVDH
ncbi:flavin reductase family protein [Subtercola lobariae]|uniref:Monooxygenase n=1 Tax=Subtercola lobariae TaxID=1588641 RepID=A0A917BB00_9MICO|nr:flavin reductase family protein [Subtercola lobariae]GGF35225.1 monooxygenase [Subtercola lobariae]